MSIRNVVQVINEAEIDAITLSDFMFKPADVMVNRRLSYPIHTMQYYLDYLDGIPQQVRDAINNTAVPSGVLADTFVTATANGTGRVARTQRSVNAQVNSLLDFDAPYSTDSTAHLNTAISTLSNEGGGVLVIPYHTGTLVISGSVTLKPNVIVKCDKNLIIDCRGSTSGYQFELSGSVGAEIALSANKGIGDSTIALAAAHNYSIGDDVLIVSQRGCAHADAGEIWRLGETTANTASPFFAEPLVVSKIDTASSFTINGRLIFPDYRTDKTAETMPTARAKSTVQKMNLAKGFEWHGGIFKKETGSLFHLIWSKEAVIDIEVLRGYGSGTEIYNRYSLGSKIKAHVSRPADAVIVENHSAYNSIKDVSSWHTNVDLHEENGIQGLDQSYAMYCGISPTYNVKHLNPQEDGMTTHGCVYGATAKVFATNSGRSAFNNRARYCKADVSGVGCHWGLTLSALGSVDGEFNLNLLNNNSHAVYLLNEGVTSTTPAYKNSAFCGSVVMSPRNIRAAFNIEPNIDTGNQLTDSGLSFKNLKIVAYNTVFDVQANNHGIDFDNVKITYYGAQPPIIFNTSTGHSIRGLTVDFKTTTGTRHAIEVVNPVVRDKSYGLIGTYIDYDSCRFINCIAINSNTESQMVKTTLQGTALENQKLTVDSGALVAFRQITVSSAGKGSNRLILDNSIPIGYVFDVLVRSTVADAWLDIYAIGATVNTVDITIADADGGNKLPIANGSKRLFKVRKIADGHFIVYT